MKLARADPARADRHRPDHVADPRERLEQLGYIAAELAAHPGNQDTSTGHVADVTDHTTLSGGFPGA